MIRLQRHTPPFPRTETPEPRDNAWGSQWKHLRLRPMRLLRHKMHDSLRTLRG